MKKRFISMLLAAALTVTFAPVPALADSNNTLTSGVFTYELSDDSHTASLDRCKTSAGGGITIPSSVSKNGKTYKVTSIDDEAFANCKSITSVVIPSSVKEIDEEAFADCTKLSKVTFKGNAPEIDDDSFKNVTATAAYPSGNKTWTASVRKNHGGKLTWKAYASTTALSTPKLNSAANASSGITVKWTSVSSASGYYVYRKELDDDNKYHKIATVKNVLSWTDKTAKNGEEYAYTVKAYNGKSTSTAASGKVMVRLTRPELKSLTAVSGLKMKASWTDTEEAEGYRLQYASNKDFKNAKSIYLDDDDTAKTISKLSKNKKYYVRVCAYEEEDDVKYYSAWSNVKAITISK